MMQDGKTSPNGPNSCLVTQQCIIPGQKQKAANKTPAIIIVFPVSLALRLLVYRRRV
jgi:hypothetical protein